MKTTMNFISAFLIASLISISGSEAAECSNDVLNRCAAPLVAFCKKSSATLAERDEACSELGNVTSCIVSDGCKETDPIYFISWVGQRDAFSYLCGEAGKVYINNVACLRSQSMQEKLSACNNTYVAAVSADNKAFCSASNTLMECFAKELKVCKAEAADFYLTYSIKALTPAATLQACLIKKPSTPSSPLAASASMQGSSQLLPLSLTLLVIAGFTRKM